MDRLRIAKELNKMAKILIADYEYIYDPDHKKHPEGGYVKTEKGWQKGKQEKKENGENKKKWKQMVKTLSSKVKEKMLQDKKCPSKILDALADEHKLKVALHPNTSAKTLDKLANDTDWNVRNSVALNSNTSAETLDKLSEDKDEWLRRNVAMNPNTSSKTLGKLDDDKSDVVYHAVTSNPNAEREQLEYIYDRIMDGYEEDKKNSEKSLLQGAKFKSDNWALTNIAKHPNAKGDTLDQLVQKFPKGTEIGDAARANLKSRGITDYEEDDNKAKKLPKYKFKGDDKTQAIIRKKFEKDQDEEETNTIYSEMAKFSRDDVAPMGVYHGRTKDQLKADFIKNMDPSNYASPQSFKKAQERIRKLSPQEFSKILASVFADEDEEI